MLQSLKDSNSLSIAFYTFNLKLKPFEVQEIAVAKINAVRHDDGFLAFIKNSTVKKYENIEEMIKFVYSQDETEFKRILVKLGINNAS